MSRIFLYSPTTVLLSDHQLEVKNASPGSLGQNHRVNTKQIKAVNASINNWAYAGICAKHIVKTYKDMCILIQLHQKELCH